MQLITDSDHKKEDRPLFLQLHKDLGGSLQHAREVLEKANAEDAVRQMDYSNTTTGAEKGVTAAFYAYGGGDYIPGR